MARRFEWLEGNLGKVAAHGRSAEEVEAAFDEVLFLKRREGDSLKMFARTPQGRRIWAMWRWDEDDLGASPFWGEECDHMIFVITAY